MNFEIMMTVGYVHVSRLWSYWHYWTPQFHPYYISMDISTTKGTTVYSVHSVIIQMNTIDYRWDKTYPVTAPRFIPVNLRMCAYVCAYVCVNICVCVCVCANVCVRVFNGYNYKYMPRSAHDIYRLDHVISRWKTFRDTIYSALSDSLVCVYLSLSLSLCIQLSLTVCCVHTHIYNDI